MKKKPWKTPEWMFPYLKHLFMSRQETEDSMNCDGSECNIEVNAPRALMCNMVQAKIRALCLLHVAGVLK